MFGAQICCLGYVGVKEGARGALRGCRGHSRVFGAQMRCFGDGVKVVFGG